jgi:hypothetical protein
MPPKSTASTAIAQHSLGEDVRTFVTDVERGFGRSRAARQVTRQALYLDEEDDFEANNHPVTAAQRVRIQQMDLQEEDGHVDAGEELGDGEGDVERVGMPEESAAAKAQWRADMRDKGFVGRLKTKVVTATPRTKQLVQREAIVRTQTHNEEMVRAKMREKTVPAFERLSAARKVATLERERKFLETAPAGGPAAAPPNNDDDGDDEGLVPRRRRANKRTQELQDLILKRQADDRAAQAPYEPPAALAITIAELEKMLVINPFGELGRKLQLGLLALPDMQAVISLLNPLLYEDEFDKSHFNTLEIVETMLMAGAKFCDIYRVKLKARLAQALDPLHYGAYIVKGDSDHPNDVALAGGHEHFCGDETTLVVMEFRCVRRNIENNNDKRQRDASKAMGADLGEAFERESRPVADEPDDNAEVNVYDDTDDGYEDGNNLKDPSKHFIYKVTLVFVEAVDDKCANETIAFAKVDEPTADNVNNDDDGDASDSSESFDIFGEPKAKVRDVPEPGANQMDEYRYDGGGPDAELGKDDDEEDDYEPSGVMKVSVTKAKILVGKWRANMLIGWLNGTTRPGPLCFRAYHISI